MYRPDRMARPDLGQRHDGEHREYHDLCGEQEPLGARRGLDSDVADRAHQDDPDHAGDPDPEPAAGGACRPEQLKRVAAGDGPNALADQVNVVPQSGSAWLRYLNASATRSIGTKASTITTGAW